MRNWDDAARRPVATQVVSAAASLVIGGVYAYFRTDGNLLAAVLVGVGMALTVGLLGREAIRDTQEGRRPRPLPVLSPFTMVVAAAGAGFLVAALVSQHWALLGAAAPLLGFAVAMTAARYVVSRR